MRAVLFLTVALVACTKDDAEVDPKTLDDDGDGINNGDETALGTDPAAADTDGDGLDDGDEVEIGTNPLFEYSVPLEDGDYVLGACPVLPSDTTGPTGTGEFDLNGDGVIEDFEYNGEMYYEEWPAYAEGDTIDNWEGLDAYGQAVSIYNFCGNFVVVSLGAAWCGPCQDLAAGLAEEMDELTDEIGNFTFFELLSQNLAGNEPTENQIDEWEEEYELYGIPVVGPQDAEQSAGLEPWDADGYIPSLILLSPDMRVISFDENLSGTTRISRAIENWLEDNE